MARLPREHHQKQTFRGYQYLEGQAPQGQAVLPMNISMVLRLH